VTGDPDATDRMVAAAAREGVEHVFVEFPDINGISRSKQLRADAFLRRWEDGIPVNLLVVAQTPRNRVPEGTGLGESVGYGDGLLRPVPRTTRRLPWREDAIRVLCDVEHDGEPLAAAPRTALKRVLATARERRPDVAFTLGHELEFYLLDGDGSGGFEPATDHKHELISWATEEVAPYYDDLTAMSDDYGVPVESLTHEHGPGQLEVLFDYGGPLDRADAAFDFKRLVKRTARSHDRWATFMSKPFGDAAASGYHLHVGAWIREDGGGTVGWNGDGSGDRDGNGGGDPGDGDSAFAAPVVARDDGDGELSAFGRSFLAGILDHADALTALCAPTLNAFKRYQPGSFAPVTASWGHDNRTAGVRLPSGVTRLENRLPSADANPYLVTAGTIAAGLLGVEADLEPPAPSAGDPAGSAPPLPTAPESALSALEADDALVDLLGEELVRAYVAVKRAELEAFSETVTDWEREQYVKTL
jgi:glutamine synthetase